MQLQLQTLECGSATLHPSHFDCRLRPAAVATSLLDATTTAAEKREKTGGGGGKVPPGEVKLVRHVNCLRT